MTRLLQLLIFSVPIGLLAWLLYVDIAPSGERLVVKEIGSVSPFIDDILPEARVGGVERSSSGSFVRVTDEPVYFSVHVPSSDFTEAEVSLVFQNDHQKVVEFGPQVDVYADAYALAPAQNLVLESLDWPRVEAGEVTLYQREPVFASVSDFFDTLPEVGEIATYQYDLHAPFRLSGYRPQRIARTTPVSLRGYHKYFTYIKEEPLNLSVDVWDMNRTYGEDTIDISVRNADGDLVKTVALPEDGNTTENEVQSDRILEVTVPDLPEGVYSVELIGTSDIFWRNPTTTQTYMTFSGRVYLGDEVGYLDHPRPVPFFTDAKHLVLETLHADALQTLRFGTEHVPLTRTHEKRQVEIQEPGVISASVPLGDVRIAGDGGFAFSRDAFFAPNPVRLSGATDLDLLEVNYILASYVPPKTEGDWVVATNTFSIPQMIDRDGDAKFVISLPGIREAQTEIRVKEIRIRFLKQPLNMKRLLTVLRERLPFGL